MSGYFLEMGTLLLAMKKALLSQSALPYLNDVRIYSGPWLAEPWNLYTVYLVPVGSPETLRADGGDSGYVKFATHVVSVECIMLVSDPTDEGTVVGRSEERVGITQFASDVAGFLERNLLGLTWSDGLECEVPPTIEFPEGAYSAVSESDVWLQGARGIYRAQTRPFLRTGTYP